MTQLPDKIGKYRVISEIARGGMGAVYKAEHPTLERTVIIKKLTIRGSSSVRERFRREASIMMDFRNEYIVDVFDHFREGPAYYIVQEYVDGLSLAELLYRERYLPERIALLIFRGCCHALSYAHDRGVIHRDIKPGNILISRNGEVKLVDFGVARIEDGSEDSLTREGVTLGTPSYMAPEQFRDTRGVDRRADIYSLGVMLYEMVTGKRPYPGSFSPGTIRQIQHGRYVRPRRHNPAISRFVDRLIRKAMRVNRARRFQDLKVVLARLSRMLGANDVAKERRELASYVAGTWKSPGYRSRLRRLVPAVAALAAVAVVAAGYYADRAGLEYRLLARQRYGELRLTVRIPQTSLAQGASSPQSLSLGPPSAAGLLVSAVLEPEGADGPNDRTPAATAPARPIPLHRDSTLETEENAVFTSGRLWMPAGTYRLIVRTPGQVVTKDLAVAPSLDRGGLGEPADGVVVTVPPVAAHALSLVVHAVSAATGRELGAGVKVELRSAEGWVLISDGEADSPAARSQAVGPLRSGATYTFRVSCDGYYPRRYRVTVDRLETSLEIDASLVPIGSAEGGRPPDRRAGERQ